MLPSMVHFSEYNHFILPSMRCLIENHMVVEHYDHEKEYNKSHTIFCCNQYQYELNKADIDNLIEDGYKFVFENLQESLPLEIEKLQNRSNVIQMVCVDDTTSNDPDFLNYNIRQVPMFFWVHDSRVFQGTIGDNQKLRQARDFSPTKKFLMLMCNQNKHRDFIVDTYQQILHQGLYSYIARNITLPGDHQFEPIGWNRSVNVDWYNLTAFSVIVETAMNIGSNRIFITEKTFKPMQLMHPFVLIGCAGSLKLLQRYHFETFDNWFDETYDQESDATKRLDLVMRLIDDFQFREFDRIIMDRLEHNYERFYNLSASQDYYDNQVINPILDFLETTP